MVKTLDNITMSIEERIKFANDNSEVTIKDTFKKKLEELESCKSKLEKIEELILKHEDYLNYGLSPDYEVLYKIKKILNG